LVPAFRGFVSYLLVIPRLKSYGFVLCSRRCLAAGAGQTGNPAHGDTLAVPIDDIAASKALVPRSQFWPIIWEYNALLCVFALWLLWCSEAREERY